MARRYYANAAPQLTLSAGITNSSPTLTVTGTFTGWPSSYPYFAGLEDGTGNFEIVLVTNVVGSVATITRAQNGTAALSHNAGATLDQVVVAQDLDEASAHIAATSNIHGISGTFVDTTSAQTLSNKTLNNPAIVGGLTIPGTLSEAGNETVGGTLAVTGATTLAGLTAGATQTAALHATGTAALDGAVTAGSTLSAAGAITAGGALSGTALSIGGTTRVDSHGVFIPATFTNEAARDAVVTSPTTGMVVYLTVPTTAGAAAGLYFYTGTIWEAFYADPTQPTWLNLTLVAGYSAIGTPSVAQIAYFQGMYHFRGLIQKSGGFTVNATNTPIAAGGISPAPTVQRNRQLPGHSAAVSCRGVLNTDGSMDFGTGASVGNYYDISPFSGTLIGS